MWTSPSVYSAPIGMKTVLSNHPNKEINERIETNESDKVSSSGENKSEEEEASKGQESRKINTNSSSNNDKRTKSWKYVLNRPPQKPGAAEVYDSNTATTLSCETASEQENSCKTIADMFKEKNQVTALTGKENNTNSTATKTTATFTSCCESEWIDLLHKWRSDGIKNTLLPYLWFREKKIVETCPQVENTYTPSLQGRTILIHAWHRRPYSGTD